MLPSDLITYFKDRFYRFSHINKCLRNKEKTAAESGSWNNLTDRISHQQELNTFFSIPWVWTLKNRILSYFPLTIEHMPSMQLSHGL